MEFTESCTRRVLLHCAKHSGREVVGALVKKGSEIAAIPMFHSRVCVPMLEVALQMMHDYELLGFYQGCIKAGDEVAHPSKLLEVLCQRISESAKSHPYVLCVDPESVDFFFAYRWENGFRKSSDIRLPAVPNSLETKEVYDFDDHFANVECDWRNPQLD